MATLPDTMRTQVMWAVDTIDKDTGADTIGRAARIVLVAYREELAKARQKELEEYLAKRKGMT